MAGLFEHFYKGNLSELLADYLLSTIGVATPTRRQFDHGDDFICNIMENDSGYLTFGNPFSIQIKSASKPKVKFGTNIPQKWKIDHISCLFRNEIPFFIGIIDKENLSLSIYDTTGLWQLYRDTQRNCSRIILIPRKKDREEERKNHERKTIPDWSNPLADGIEYTIDLGNPIIDITEKDIHNKELLHNKKKLLKEVIKIEQENILHRKLGVFAFKEIKNNLRNRQLTNNRAWGMEIRSFQKPKTSELYNSLRIPLISLLVNLDPTKINEISAVTTILKFLPKEDYYQQLLNSNPKLFNWVKEM